MTFIEALARIIGAIVQEICAFVVQEILVEIGKVVISACSFGRWRIDETSDFQIVVAGVVGFIVVGAVLTSPFWLPLSNAP